MRAPRPSPFDTLMVTAWVTACGDRETVILSLSTVILGLSTVILGLSTVILSLAVILSLSKEGGTLTRSYLASLNSASITSSVGTSPAE